ncbi:biogenesis of lysosome-related organelles complex 1 subunit 5 isoform X1 [Stegostoma tigrinum]|uniref:biogenesis of lysosome-related organelles complex 1 subunit 5 isoform X1 n=1 Tax=Stegostoma tigrinum TaxID=3053191 RepID=UPI00202AD82A|nr:biogenesis of lysosome-related organelles complex 1 subunit 5 isoform X1 [Stegostoma tigrinum]
MERARRDLSEIHSRLFDHRPIIQADIRYFIKEFEEKRGFREQRGLAGVNNLIIELNDRVLPQTCESMNSNLPSVLAKFWDFFPVEAAKQITNRIQQREQEADQKDRLQAIRERRKAEWEAFVIEQRRKSAEVEEEHVKTVEWVKEQYVRMEEDLAKFRTF